MKQNIETKCEGQQGNLCFFTGQDCKEPRKETCEQYHYVMERRNRQNRINLAYKQGSMRYVR